MVRLAKFLFITIVLIYSQALSGQRVYKAIILDQTTNQPIENANVLIVNSSEGYYSDKKGMINIPGFSASGADIIISHVNYDIGTKYIPLRFQKMDTIRLSVKSYELEDVTIKSDKNDLKEKRLKIFRRDLFDFTAGKRNMYKEVKFLNPKDILFYVENDFLKAKSSELLQFRNNFLGYDIKCLLSTYTRDTYDLTFEGKAIYQEYEASKRKAKKFLKRRNELWKITQQNFLRQVIHNNLDTKSFACKALITGRYKEGYLPVEDFKGFVYPTKIEGVYALICPAPISIEYNNQLSHIIAYEGIVILNKNGLILNKHEVKIVGDWSQKSLTKSLPTDYKPIPKHDSPFQHGPKRSISELRIIAQNLKSSSNLILPIDEVLIETDKSLYNSYDRVYVGAHVYDHQTRSPIDNCLIKIELVNKNGEIIASKTKEVMNGTALTSFLLTDTIQSGQYGVRAYTSHMRNFSENLYGKTTIAIDQLHTNIQMEASDTVHINFAPEGGKLLYELENRIIAHITDDKGRPISYNGTLTDNFTREQAAINTITPGLAVFNLLPNKGSNYSLTSNKKQPTLSNTDQLRPISGTNIHVFCRNKDRYKISILSKNDSTTISKLRISDKGVSVYDTDPEQLSSFSISKEYLPNEILAFQLIDGNSQIISERLVDNRKNVEPLISFKKQYEFFYKNQQCEIDIVPNPNSDLFIDSLKWSIRVVDENSHQKRGNNNLSQNYELSDEVDGLSITNQSYIQNLKLIGNSFLSEYETAYKKNINDLAYKNDFMLSITGNLKNPENLDKSEKGRLSITSMSDIPYNTEVSSNDDGDFIFEDLPYGSNLNFIIQARMGVNDDEKILEGSRFLEINIDTIHKNQALSATSFNFRSDLISNDSLITYRREFNKSLADGIQLDQVTIKSQVVNSIGSGEVKDIEKMDWITKDQSGQSLMKQLYPSRIIRRSIKDPSQMEIQVNTRNDGFVYQPLIVLLNGTIEYSSAIFENLVADRIKYINLSQNVVSITTNPGMQSRTAIREESLGIKSHIIPETIDDTNIDELNNVSFREFSFLANRKVLYWKPDTRITKSNTKSVNFRSSNRTGTYKMIASTIHPLLGYISYSIPFQIEENKE